MISCFSPRNSRKLVGHIGKTDTFAYNIECVYTYIYICHMLKDLFFPLEDLNVKAIDEQKEFKNATTNKR